MKTYEMKTYDETARTVLARMETQIEKNKKRNRVIRTVAAFTCFAVFAVTAVFGVKAMDILLRSGERGIRRTMKRSAIR